VVLATVIGAECRWMPTSVARGRPSRSRWSTRRPV